MPTELTDAWRTVAVLNKDQFNALWRLMYDHDYRDGPDKPEPSQEAEA